MAPMATLPLGGEPVHFPSAQNIDRQFLPGSPAVKQHPLPPPPLPISPQRFIDREKLVAALAHETVLPQGMLLHSQIVDSDFQHDAFLSNLLISMYSRCGSLPDALRVFDAIDQPSVASWNSLLGAFCKHGSAPQAVTFYCEMRHAGIAPDRVTFMSLLGVCAAQKALFEGKYVHCCAVECGLDMDVNVENALINMYGKCGALQLAISVFEKMHQSNVVSWTIMISAYIQNGNASEALEAFHTMKNEKIEPDKVAYISLLGGCIAPERLTEGRLLHASIIERGLNFDTIVQNALVSMYGKCRALEDACILFESMQARNLASWNAMITALCTHDNPKGAFEIFHLMQCEGFKPDNVTLTCLLTACVVPADLIYGRAIHAYVVKNKLELDLRTESALVNMYAKCGALKEAQVVFDGMLQHDVVSWTGIITAYAQQGFGQEALQLFQQMQQVSIKPNGVTFLCLLSACGHTGLVNEAWVFFHAMTERYGIMPDLKHYTCMVDILGRAGWLVEAEKLILEMPSQADIQLWLTYLGACSVHGDVERGESAAKEVFELDSKNRAAFMLLSNIYAAAEKWEDVEKVKQTMIDRGVDLQVTDSLPFQHA